MGIREYSKNWRLSLNSEIDKSSKPMLMEKAAKNIEKKYSEIQPRFPSKTELKIVFSYIYKNFNDKKRIGEIKAKYLRKAPWVIFTYPDSHPGILGKNEEFSKQYLSWAISRKKSRIASSLLFVFLRDYPIEFKTFQLWMSGIKKILSKMDSPKIRLLEKKCNSYYFLERFGPNAFGDYLLRYNNEPDEIFERAGLTGLLQTQGFALSVYQECSKSIQKELSSGSNQYDVLNKYIKLSQHQKEGRNVLRFKSESSRMANSLLLPFTGKSGNEGNIKTIQKFLINHLGDPRVKSTNWISVSERAKNVMFGWLVEATLDVFFKILDATADKIWKYRKAFWNAYYQKGVIKRAWAILGRDAIKIAINKRLNDKRIQFGELSGAYTRNQSVLLIEIGNFVIAEWSHNGKCRIWKNSNEGTKNIPKLYNHITSYEASTLREGADFDQIHHASPHGTWQNEIETYIRNYTNIKVTYSEYMP